MGLLSHAVATTLAAALPVAPQPAATLPAATLPAATLPAATLPAAPEIVPTHNDAAQRMTIAVHIGANGPFRFLLDTGAEHTVLSDSLAVRLGLARGEHRVISSVAGMLDVATVSLANIQIGRRSFDDPIVPLLPASSIQADGILGIDGLRGQRVLLDFSHNLMSITDLPEAHEDAGYEIVVTAKRRGAQLILTRARIDDIDVDVVIDTGADISIGNRALQRAMMRYGRATPTRLSSVTGQEIDADLSTGGTLVMNRLSISNMEIAYADTRVFASLRLEKRPAILLGMHALRAMRRVMIDFAHRKVLFDLNN